MAQGHIEPHCTAMVKVSGDRFNAANGKDICRIAKSHVNPLNPALLSLSFPCPLAPWGSLVNLYFVYVHCVIFEKSDSIFTEISYGL